MKARVKATGEIVDVVFESSYVKDGVKVSLWTDGKKEYSKDSLDFIDTDIPSEQRMRYELGMILQMTCRNTYKVLCVKFYNYNYEQTRIGNKDLLSVSNRPDG